jgi:hypothetical protein
MTKEIASEIIENNKLNYKGKRIMRLKDKFEFTVIDLISLEIDEKYRVRFSDKEEGWQVCCVYEITEEETKWIPFNEVLTGILAGSTYKFI